MKHVNIPMNKMPQSNIGSNQYWIDRGMGWVIKVKVERFWMGVNFPNMTWVGTPLPDHLPVDVSFSW